MASERFNNGALWPVKEKRSERSPGYQGTVNVNGVLYFVDGWVKEKHDGSKFLSLAFKKRDKQEGAEQAPVSDLDVPQ